MRLIGRVGVIKRFALFASLLCLFHLGGCASLPSTESVFQYSPTTEEVPLAMVGAHRRLTARESRLILKRLKRRTLPTGILERHLAVEEAICGNPLVVGNKATLLIDGPDTYAAMSEAIQ